MKLSIRIHVGSVRREKTVCWIKQFFVWFCLSLSFWKKWSGIKWLNNSCETTWKFLELKLQLISPKFVNQIFIKMKHTKMKFMKIKHGRQLNRFSLRLLEIHRGATNHFVYKSTTMVISVINWSSGMTRVLGTPCKTSAGFLRRPAGWAAWEFG